MGNICKKLLSRNKAGPKTRCVFSNLMVHEDVPYRNKNHPNREYPSNHVKTTKYTVLTFLPKNLFEQFHRYANIYFIFVVLLNWIPEVGAFGKEISAVPVVFVLAVTAFKDAFEDFRRYQSDKRVNLSKCRRYSREDRRYVKVDWRQVHVGDFVHLSCNEIIPADILLLRSSDSSALCHIETANIDGETNLKQRHVVAGLNYTAEDFHPTKFHHEIECDLPGPDIYKFHGNILVRERRITINQSNLLLRGCRIRNTDFVEGLVIYAGPETKAMLNNRGPRYKRSKLERRLNRDLVWCVILLLFMCFFCAIGSGIWVADYPDASKVPFIPLKQLDDYSPLYLGFIVFWTYIIIFQAVIPLPLYVSLELIKIGQVYFIQNDKEMYYEPVDRRMECRALNITEDLGQVEYIFSDKTGTLTENIMEFKSCTIGGIDFPHGCDVDETMSDFQTSRQSISNISMISRASSEYLDLKLEPSLVRDVHNMCLRSLESINVSITSTISYQSKRVMDFFLLMAICNTVVVSPHEHQDMMDESGYIQDTHGSNGTDRKKSSNLEPPGPPFVERYSRLEDPPLRDVTRGIDNAAYNNDDDFFRSWTPSEGSITDTSIMSEATLSGRYDAESPDELALVKAASTYGCRLMKRTLANVSIYLPSEGVVEYEMLHVLPFDSTRKRMSVIVRHPTSGETIMYTKGADSAILGSLQHRYKEKEDDKIFMKQTLDHLDAYAKKGLRTLCMAKRVISPEEYKEWQVQHEAAENAMEDRETLLFESACRIETELELLGATGIEDKLQEGVPETIAKLRKAGIKVWVLTGDKQETAIEVAYGSKLISYGQNVIIVNGTDEETTTGLLEHHIEQIEKDFATLETARVAGEGSVKKSKLSPQKVEKVIKPSAMVIDGKTLNFALKPGLEKLFLRLSTKCTSVVCCRTTPIQKAAVVRLVRDELKKVTLSIGDGANDVSMIQTADIGVGISGQEGMQAVMASDFSLARFKFLQQLLLVHGHWCYDRLARFALYMFYKNPMPNMTIFWFQIYSGFSSSISLDSYYLLLLHVLFTAVPPIVNGILDKDVSAETLLANPGLYKSGIEGRSYTTLLFWVYMLEAVFQSIVLHFVPHMAYAGSDVGIWEMGVTITVALILTMLLFLGLETPSWTWIHWVIVVCSFLFFWIFAIVLGAICLDCDPPSNPYWVFQNTITTPNHWLLIFLTCTLALLPRFTYRSMQMSLFPDEMLKAKMREKLGITEDSGTKRASKRRSQRESKHQGNLDLQSSPVASARKPEIVINGHRPATSSSVEVDVGASPKSQKGSPRHTAMTTESKAL